MAFEIKTLNVKCVMAAVAVLALPACATVDIVGPGAAAKVASASPEQTLVRESAAESVAQFAAAGWTSGPDMMQAATYKAMNVLAHGWRTAQLASDALDPADAYADRLREAAPEDGPAAALALVQDINAAAAHLVTVRSAAEALAASAHSTPRDTLVLDVAAIERALGAGRQALAVFAAAADELLGVEPSDARAPVDAALLAFEDERRALAIAADTVNALRDDMFVG
jgi:hypothetical protein